MAGGPRRVEDVACTVCGCVCDDLTIEVDERGIVAAERSCELSQPWFLDPRNMTSPPPRVAGLEVGFDEAVEAAAAILTASRAPLVYGLSRSSTPGQRAAVRLADQLGATIDTTASTCHAPSIMALQSEGESTATLGEIKNRSDLIVYWGSNPLKSHPRHIERNVEAAGLFVPRGRAGRHLVVVDVERTATAERADTFLQVPRGADFEVLWALRMLVGGLPLEADRVGGVASEKLVRLADRLTECRYGTFFFGLGLTSGGLPHVNVDALLRLTRDLNSHTRFVARRMRVPGDVAGADSVLCWQTGFPFSVNLSRGYPRYNPGEYTANVMLTRGEVDAVVLVGSEGVEKLSPGARQRLGELPRIVLDYPNATPIVSPRVQFTTAIYGLHRAGTAYRMDEVPIGLRQVMASSLPSDAEVLGAIAMSLKNVHRWQR